MAMVRKIEVASDRPTLNVHNNHARKGATKLRRTAGHALLDHKRNADVYNNYKRTKTSKKKKAELNGNNV